MIDLIQTKSSFVALRRRWHDYQLLVLPLSLLGISIFAKPVPLVGGGTDDYKYLSAAKCLRCLPANHWERRFPIVWPTGAAIDLFGLNLWSVMIFPVLAAVAATVLLFVLTKKRYGPISAAIAASVLVLTPIFGERSMRIGVDIIELALVLGALLVIQRNAWSGWSGALVGLAVLCRPTQFAVLPPFLLLLWWKDRREIPAFLLAFAFPILLETVVYWVAANDPLYSWKLSLHHTQIPSPFLSPSVDTSRSPLFSPDFIGGWVPSAGVKAPWPIQGLINLMLNEAVAMTFWAALIFSALVAKHLDRLQIALLLVGAFYFGAMTYAFAVDPEPRMFMPVIAIAAVLIGSTVPLLWAWPKKVVALVVLSLVGVLGVAGVATRNDYRDGALVAAGLAKSDNYKLTPNAVERMALVGPVRQGSSGHLLDIAHTCRQELDGRSLLSAGKNICIYR